MVPENDGFIPAQGVRDGSAFVLFEGDAAVVKAD